MLGYLERKELLSKMYKSGDDRESISESLKIVQGREAESAYSFVCCVDCSKVQVSVFFQV